MGVVYEAVAVPGGFMAITSLIEWPNIRLFVALKATLALA
jgi:hypothetical protein